jgi:hypothetical protein
MKKSIGQYILIDPEEVPCSEKLKTSIDRLKKDADIFRHMPNSKWPLKHLEATISFLELMLNRKTD